MKHKFFILLCFCILAACASRKKAEENIPVSSQPAMSYAELFSKINASPEFENLKINAKVNVETGQFIPVLSATIYIENQKKIWANFAALMLNVARGMATKDGIKAYEKWNKTYIDSNFDYLNDLLNVNFIDYQAVQRIFLGRTFIPLTEADYRVIPSAQGFHLQSDTDQVFTKNGKTSVYSVSLDYDLQGNLIQTSLTEKQTGEQLNIAYSGWATEGGIALPKYVKITIKGAKDSQILIENTNFAFVSMETPYSVPSNYTKTDIK